MKKTIIIGTRSSQLSLIQTNIIKNLLQPLLPHTTIEIMTIKTQGDKNLSPIPLDTIGKGWFTKEIDNQLLEERIDIAVHSLKDLLDTLTPGLIITAIPKREDASEAFVAKDGSTLQRIKKGSVIGTDSIRRKIQLLEKRPDLIIKSVRGNVNKRLEKLDAGEYDGLMLAVAGLKRLGLDYRTTEYLDPTDIIPSPGQGALAVVTKQNNKELNTVLKKLNDPLTVTAVMAERMFSKLANGGCSMPVGAYTKISKSSITLYGMIGSEDEQHMIKDNISGDINDTEKLAKTLAERMLQQTSSWSKPQYVVLTREAKENKSMQKKIEFLGLKPLVCPSVSFASNLSIKQFNTFFKMGTYDWIVFTSSNGVKFFFNLFEKSRMDLSIIRNCKIAAVGEKTANIVESFGLEVTSMPEKYTAKGFVQSLQNLQEKKLLLPRSTIANNEIVKQLEKKGAIVTTMPVYKTKFMKNNPNELSKLLKSQQILCLTFTSPSTIHGFLNNVDKNIMSEILSLPVISIGPVTAAAAKKHGFKQIYTADYHTTDGMIRKLKQSIL